MPRKSFVMSRTVWAVIAMLAFALFGMFAPERADISLAPDTLRALCGVVVLGCAVAAIYFRSCANINLRFADGDGQLAAQVTVPLLLLLCLTMTGCIGKSDNGTALTPLQHTQVIVGALNDTYIPARKVYEEVYNLAGEETKAILNAKVNPVMNKASEALINVSTLLILWAKTNEKPQEMGEALEKAQELVPKAVQAMATASTKPVTKKE